MKNIVFLISIFLLVSCGGNKSNKGDSNDNSTEKKVEQSALAGCDEFLDDYEEWVDEVIKVYQKVKENPLDVQNTQKMMEATNKMAGWSEKWAKLFDCANDEKYAKRMEELEERVNKAMEE